MADNADSTNSKQLPSFSTLKPFEQLAITLRAEGKLWEEVTNTINAEYKLAYKQITIRQWFIAGARLEQAYLEYLEFHADLAVAEAKLKIKKMSKKAAETLNDLMSDKYDGTVRHNAAKTTLSKYVPDRQVVVDESKADEIPSAIVDAGDKALDEDENGQEQVADAPASESAGPDTGSGSS